MHNCRKPSAILSWGNCAKIVAVPLERNNQNTLRAFMRERERERERQREYNGYRK